MLGCDSGPFEAKTGHMLIPFAQAGVSRAYVVGSV
jgi:hypothetical protein